ncbi:hypothetical protein GF327_02820 [Candidatus Woesearchaeota archaeon]|nr:hypothetical protein [Candidatus Woesearchaeota archaeon]
MIIDILRIIIAALFSLFIPGFIIVYIFFEEFTLLEKISFSVAFSIMIDIAIAIILGYNKDIANLTGGLTFASIIKAEIIVIMILGIIYLIKYIKKNENKKKNKKK